MLSSVELKELLQNYNYKVALAFSRGGGRRERSGSNRRDLETGSPKDSTNCLYSPPPPPPPPTPPPHHTTHTHARVAIRVCIYTILLCCHLSFLLCYHLSFMKTYGMYTAWITSNKLVGSNNNLGTKGSCMCIQLAINLQ